MPFDDTGNRRDAESGLLYLRARLYDPATGRFLSPDPAGDCPSTPLAAHVIGALFADVTTAAFRPEEDDGGAAAVVLATVVHERIDHATRTRE